MKKKALIILILLVFAAFLLNACTSRKQNASSGEAVVPGPGSEEHT